MKSYEIENVMMDEYVGLEAIVKIEGKEYKIAEQVEKTDEGILPLS